MEKREIYNIICKCCSKSFEIKVTPTKFKDGNHKIFCSLSCANSFNKSGNKHPMFGKELSDTHKEKIKSSLNNEEFKKQAKRPHKQKFKDKYGDLWEEHYNMFLISMSNTNTLDWFIKQYGEIDGLLKYEERIENLKVNSHFVNHPEDSWSETYSKVSQELFWEIYKHIKDSYKEIYFAELNHEHSCSTGPYRFDFVVMDNKKIIEFNGDKFHPKNLNEEELLNWFTPHGISGQIITNRDLEKKERANNKGYEILYIWENEYKQDKKIILDKCISFLTN